NHLRINDISDDGLIFTGEIFVQERDQLLSIDLLTRFLAVRFRHDQAPSELLKKPQVQRVLAKLVPFFYLRNACIRAFSGFICVGKMRKTCALGIVYPRSKKPLFPSTSAHIRVSGVVAEWSKAHP